MTSSTTDVPSHALMALEASLVRGTPDCFSSDGSRALVSAHDEYLEALGLTAIRSARVAKSDVVSATDIHRANRTLLAGASSLLDWLKWLGGLSLGVAIPLTINLANAKQDEISTSMIITLLVTTSVGLAATLVALMSDVARRS